MKELDQLDSILPIPDPTVLGTKRESRKHFYTNVLKLLVKPSIAMMNAGIQLDMDKVYSLDKKLDILLLEVATGLAANAYITAFQQVQYTKTKATYIRENKEKQRSMDYYLKPIDITKMDHRSYLMNYISYNTNWDYVPEGLLPDGSISWKVKDVKAVNELHPSPILQDIIDKEVNPDHPKALAAMRMLAITRSNLYNKKYHEKLQNIPADLLAPFSPGSPKQKKEFFEHFNVAPLAYSKTSGEASWGRDELVEVLNTTQDTVLKDALSSMITFSQGAIIKTNFVKGFIDYSIDGRLYSNIKLFGTKTMRPTSGGKGYLNFLNMPSTGSPFAKLIKECIIAKPGFILLDADFSALENRVIACLSKDQNLTDIYLHGLDGHCANSLYYFKEEIAEHIELTGDTTVDTRTYADAISAGNKELKAIRQKGKGPSFGMQYGAFPKKVASSIGCSIEEATVIFNRYHNELYPNVTKFREEYVLPMAKKEGEVYMGLGCRIRTDDPKRDIRTVTNSCSQFWSILTLIALAKMFWHIQKDGMQDRVTIVNTVYDACYLEVRKDPETIKWANKTLCKCMNVDFIEGQTVPNESACEIGPSLANHIELSQTATIEEIQTILEGMG